jgi:trk system potassium uptake protein TrkA
MALTGVKQQRRHRVMILGGGLVGCRVAELMGKDVRVKIVEKDENRAAELCHPADACRGASRGRLRCRSP